MRNHHPSLDRGIVRIISLVLAGLGLAQALLLGAATGRRFRAIEDAASEIDLRRTIASIDVERSALSDLAREYAAWDDALAYVRGDNPGFPIEAFPPVWMDRVGLDYIVVADLEGKTIWSKERVPFLAGDLGGARSISAPGGDGLLLPSLSDLRSDAATNMLVRAGDSVVLAGAYPITSSDFLAPGEGWVIFAKRLDSGVLLQLGQRAGLHTRLLDAEETQAFDAEARPLGDPSLGATILDRGRSRSLLIDLRSPWGGLLGGLEFSREQTLTEPLQAFLAALVGMLLVSGIVAALILSFLLRRKVVRPLGRIAEHLADCEREGVPIGTLALGREQGRADEIGLVADRVDHLLGALERRRNDLEMVNSELERLSRIDHLTGLANRRSLDEHARRELRRMARERRGRDNIEIVSVLIGDLDHFKLYNDRYGHRAGDACLRAVADAIASSVHRPGDLACRFGGEEFLVFLPGADHEGARVVAEGIRRAVRSLDLPHEDSPTAPMVTISIGGASRVLSDAEFDLGSLVDIADAALYEAKGSGRDRVVVAD